MSGPSSAASVQEGGLFFENSSHYLLALVHSRKNWVVCRSSQTTNEEKQWNTRVLMICIVTAVVIVVSRRCETVAGECHRYHRYLCRLSVDVRQPSNYCRHRRCCWLLCCQLVCACRWKQTPEWQGVNVWSLWRVEGEPSSSGVTHSPPCFVTTASKISPLIRGKAGYGDSPKSSAREWGWSRHAECEYPLHQGEDDFLLTVSNTRAHHTHHSRHFWYNHLPVCPHQLCRETIRSCEQNFF